MTWTAARLLQWATEDFQGRGLDGPRRSAEILLSSALNTDRVGLYLQYDRPVTQEERDRFRALVEKRRAGTPVAYLTKEREFYALPLTVDERVLIPRPETELLVDEALQWIEAHGWTEPRVCDVGTGSGAIALALKKNGPNIQMTATDISAEALDVARLNAESLGLDIRFIESDLLGEVEEDFDLIVANLPYIPEESIKTLSHEIRDFEPLRALEAGTDGLKFIRALIDSAKDRLREGFLFLEMGMGQENMVSELLEKAGYTVEGIREDLSGIPRIIKARTGF